MEAAEVAETYRRFGGLLYSVARSILDEDEAADAVHDVLVRLWRDDTYHADRGTLRAFLVVCVRNDALAKARSSRRRLERERAAARMEPAVVSGLDADALERLRVDRALGTLPPEQREVIELAFYRAYTQREIAVALGIPLGTVKGRVSLALRKLQAALSGGEATA